FDRGSSRLPIDTAGADPEAQARARAPASLVRARCSRRSSGPLPTRLSRSNGKLLAEFSEGFHPPGEQDHATMHVGPELVLKRGGAEYAIFSEALAEERDEHRIVFAEESAPIDLAIR